jgi:hypothetical protein
MIERGILKEYEHHAPTSASPPAAPTAEDKEFLSRGYKLEMRHGEKYFCRREPQIGSRFEIKSCTTADALRAQQESAQEAMRRIQSMSPTNGN